MHGPHGLPGLIEIMIGAHKHVCFVRFLQATTEMWVKMKGGQNLEVRMENAVSVSTNLVCICVCACVHALLCIGVFAHKSTAAVMLP